MAKRWLVLQSNGQLSYSMQPNHKARDTCSISSASIGLSELSRTMVIDTGVAVWKASAIIHPSIPLLAAFSNLADLGPAAG